MLQSRFNAYTAISLPGAVCACKLVKSLEPDKAALAINRNYATQHAADFSCLDISGEAIGRMK